MKMPQDPPSPTKLALDPDDAHDSVTIPPRRSILLSHMIVWLLSPFSPLPKKGAHESRTAVLARFLIDAGHEVVWLASDFDHRRKDRAERGALAAGTQPTVILIPTPRYEKNISLRRFWSHRVWGNRLISTALRKVAQSELRSPDLILASSPPLDAPRAALRLKKKFNCRVIIDLTDLWPHTFERIFGKSEVKDQGPKGEHVLLKPLYKQAHTQWQKADGISAMSSEYLEEVLRIAPEQDTHLCYIGGKVQTRERQSLMKSKAAPKPSPITPQSGISFLYLGALTDSYDFSTLFGAAARLSEEERDFHIHIAGSGPLQSHLELETQHSNLTRRVTFHGFLQEEDMQALCAQCDVGLNIIRPGLHITMPHKLNDYLCAGLPVINSLQGEAENLLKQYHAGVTYVPGDPDSLADSMRSWLLDPENKKTAPENGAVRLAEDLLDRETTYAQWVSWITDVSTSYTPHTTG